MIDWITPFARKVKRHLRSERIIWLTTVGPDGVPHPRPVWFVWDEAETSLLIYSKPNMQKLRDIAVHPVVSLNFNTDSVGDIDVIILTGTAQLNLNAALPHHVPTYVRRYRQQMRESLHLTPAQYSAAFTVAIRVTPTAMRGW